MHTLCTCGIRTLHFTRCLLSGRFFPDIVFFISMLPIIAVDYSSPALRPRALVIYSLPSDRGCILYFIFYELFGFVSHG